MDFKDVIEQMKTQHAQNLKEMPLPPGAEEYLRSSIALGDVDTVTFMVKLAWVFGAQAGQAAVMQAQQVAAQPQKRRIEA